MEVVANETTLLQPPDDQVELPFQWRMLLQHHSDAVGREALLDEKKRKEKIMEIHLVGLASKFSEYNKILRVHRSSLKIFGDY